MIAGMAMLAVVAACGTSRSGTPSASVPFGSSGLDTYDSQEVDDALLQFYGDLSVNVAQAIDRLFSEYGEPNAYITGTDASGAFFAGLVYGEGTLHLKNGETRKVYWQGPSVGFDFGLTGTKVFMLVYNLKHPERIYQRFPGVDGRAFVLGGVGVNYLQSADTAVVPVRAGHGFRLGASVGYLKFTEENQANPF